MFTRLNGMMFGTSTLHEKLESSKAPSCRRFEEILLGFNELEFIDGAHRFEAQAREHRDWKSNGCGEVSGGFRRRSAAEKLLEHVEDLEREGFFGSNSCAF
ncbi:hypothetical protein NL676_029723 [Syzygium grande]|nr:hypothetical protein NL676_029723 [Syzygium grande]